MTTTYPVPMWVYMDTPPAADEHPEAVIAWIALAVLAWVVVGVVAWLVARR